MHIIKTLAGFATNIREFKIQVKLLKVICVLTPHGSVVMNAACKTNDFNFEVAVEVELVS